MIYSVVSLFMALCFSGYMKDSMARGKLVINFGVVYFVVLPHNCFVITFMHDIVGLLFELFYIN